MGITLDVPISIKIQKDFNQGLSSKLATQKTKDWKLAIPEIKSSDNVQGLFQDVLDLISPTKSPMRSDLAKSPVRKDSAKSDGTTKSSTAESENVEQDLEDDGLDLQGLSLTNKVFYR
jgi:hypothetical protein